METSGRTPLIFEYYAWKQKWAIKLKEVSEYNWSQYLHIKLYVVRTVAVSSRWKQSPALHGLVPCLGVHTPVPVANLWAQITTDYWTPESKDIKMWHGTVIHENILTTL